VRGSRRTPNALQTHPKRTPIASSLFEAQNSQPSLLLYAVVPAGAPCAMFIYARRKDDRETLTDTLKDGGTSTTQSTPTPPPRPSLHEAQAPAQVPVQVPTAKPCPTQRSRSNEQRARCLASRLLGCI
jgi:hypothetical protein